MPKQNGPKSTNKALLITTIAIMFLITSCSSIILGNYLASRGIYFTRVSNEVEKSSQLIGDTQKYESLFIVRDTLLKKYDGEINDDKLLEGAIKGMTNALGDPYTVFYNKKEYEKLMKKSDGSLEGIGVQIASIDNKIIIVSPMKNSPAEKAGLKSGDVIEKIDGKTYKGDNFDDAVAYIASKDHEEFILTINRNEEEFDVTIKKQVIKIESIEGQMLDSNIGYIKIDTFMNENTAEDFKNEIKTLESDGMKGLILDLRNNPGGLLSQAVGVASQFIPKNKIITYTVDKYNNKNESLSVGGLAEGMPLIVLVNNNSASASEVVTGALRDYKAATIIGKTTFGKGIVQQPFEFKNGIGGLKVTISKYYTPNGENIHKKGINPDYDVDISEDIDSENYVQENDEQLNKAREKMSEKIK